MFKNSLFTVHTFSKSPYFTDPLSPFTLCPIFLFHRSHYNLKDTIKNYHK